VNAAHAGIQYPNHDEMIKAILQKVTAMAIFLSRLTVYLRFVLITSNILSVSSISSIILCSAYRILLVSELIMALIHF